MSTFSGGQVETLVDMFWNLDCVRCPHDGAEIRSCLYSQMAGYLLVLACPRCGTKVQVTRYSDPKRTAFRVWTDSEREALAMEHEVGRSVNCPVCRARINCRTMCESIRVFECARCGNLHEAMSFSSEPRSREPPRHTHAHNDHHRHFVS